MATIRDVAQLAKTSTAAVSAALNGAAPGKIRVGAETRARIVAAARELGYTSHRVARNQALGRIGALGIVLPYVSGFVDRNPFCSEVINATTRCAIIAGYNVMLHTALGDVWNAFRPEDIVDTRADGYLLVLPDPASPVVEHLHRKRIPYAALIYAPENAEVFAVNADERQGGRLATEHLLSLGHRRIGHLTGDPMVATSLQRRQGYFDAMTAAGLEADPCWVIPADFDDETGFRAMQQVLSLPSDRRPTAVFCANDLCAGGALRAVREAGLRVPEDIALVGYDDTEYAVLTDPPLTSIRMPIAEMCNAAVELIHNQILGRGGDRQRVLAVTLSVRASTAPPT